MKVTPSAMFKTLTPEVQLGYNADGDLIQIKKTFIGITWLRIIIDPDVIDAAVNKWVIFGDWSIL